MGTAAKTQMADHKNEELCSYAALILADADEEVTADNMTKLIKAAGGDVPAFYLQLFEKVAGMTPVTDMVKDASKVGSGAPAGAAPAAATTGGGDAPAAAAKKSSSESDGGDMAGGGLFGEEEAGKHVDLTSMITQPS